MAHLTRERLETLHEMLCRYEQARAEANAGGATGKHNDSRLLLFDHRTWTPAYRELERCLDLLRSEAASDRELRRLWWHLRSRYLQTRVRRMEVHTRRTHSGERVVARLPRNQEIVARPTILHGKTQFMQVRYWDERVDPQVVGVGLRWISTHYRGTPAVYAESDAA